MTAEGDYEREKGPQIFKLMKQTDIESLSLSDNCQSSIINKIEHIKFHKLKLLNLSENQITSIETLSTFYFPNLSTLNLLRNYIVSIKPFIKMHCPYLQILEIEDNLITDLTPISEMSCIASLREIAINFMIETICCDNISWVSKISCPLFTQICSE